MLLRYLVLGLILSSGTVLFASLAGDNPLRNSSSYDIEHPQASQLSCQDPFFTATFGATLEQFEDIFSSCGEYGEKPGDDQVVAPGELYKLKGY